MDDTCDGGRRQIQTGIACPHPVSFEVSRSIWSGDEILVRFAVLLCSVLLHFPLPVLVKPVCACGGRCAERAGGLVHCSRIESRSAYVDLFLPSSSRNLRLCDDRYPVYARYRKPSNEILMKREKV